MGDNFQETLDPFFWKNLEYTNNLYLSLGKCSRQQTDDIFLFFPENRILHFMQIVSIGDNLHDMSNPVSWEKK